MTIHEASQRLRFQLFHIYDEREAGNISELVMEHITGWKKIDRLVNKTAGLSAQQEQLLATCIAELLENKPLQYVLHEAWFYDMPLYVDENVLIPRPETEELVDWLIKDAHSSKLLVRSKQAIRLLDIGTGSGCIPLAMKKSIPAIEVHACDISETALSVAKKNATDLKLDIHFHLLDILSETERKQLPLFDIIISNPPYIPQKDQIDMAPNVLLYEPHPALFVPDNDPLLFYKAIADFATSQLTKNGLIYLEIHEAMAAAIVELYTQKGFAGIEVKKDMQEKKRMVKISAFPPA